MKRRVFDSEKAFQQATGFSSSVYKRIYGSAECHRRQADVLQDLLVNNTRNSVIVCSWMDRGVQSLLREFARSNPVIHIIRDRRAIQDHLKIQDEDKIQNLLTVSSSIFRNCSNFEFYNISEAPSEPTAATALPGGSSSIQRAPAPYLTLKRAERHFLKLLSLIMPKETIPFIESAFPLASIPTEERQFTYAVSITLSRLLENDTDIEALETGADAIEIVIDDLTRQIPVSVDGIQSLEPGRASEIARILSSIRRSTVIPLIYHVELPELLSEPSTRSKFERVYIDYVNHGLRLAPEYVTIDLNLPDIQLAEVVSLKRRSKIIAHAHPSRGAGGPWHNAMWSDYYKRAQNQGCDLVRLIKTATTMLDNFEVDRLRSLTSSLGEPQLPVIAYNSGRLGRHSACFNKILTAVSPEGLSDHEPRHGTSPRLTALQATNALYSSFIYDPMKLYVFGANVSYSMSPPMHNAALKACGIPHHYKPFSTVSLSGIKEFLEDPNFAGASIGLPFKVEVITLTHSLSRHARAIGAVNTLIPIRHLNEDGSIPDDSKLFNYQNRAGPVKALYGENTDWIGIRACIRRGLSPANAVRPTSCGLVIGAGGMARAAVYSMLQLGVKNIVIFNRTFANAEKLVAHFEQLLSRSDLPLLSTTQDVQTKFHILHSLEDRWPDDYRLPTMIVSCIPTHSIGDVPAPNFSVPPELLNGPTGGVVVELAYKTLDTPLLTQLRHEAYRGWVTMDGLDLLPEQGFAQFELFTGRRAPRRLMRREVFKSYPEDQDGSTLAQLEPRMRSILEQEP
jgi:shikimate 5-dehydrogenase